MAQIKRAAMIRDEVEWLALADTFHAAALGRTAWYSALEDLARATGSEHGELIGIGSNASVPFNIVTNIDPKFHEAFDAVSGGDPRKNPRVNAGMHAPILKVLAEADFMTPEEHRTHPHYHDFARPWNIPYICLATLERGEDSLIGLAVVRTREQGHIDSQQRRVFASIAPHVRAAVRTHKALQGQAEKLLSGAMEALSIPAFICDCYGRVSRLSPSAEQIIAGDSGLVLKSGRLTAVLALDAKTLLDAIEQAARPLIVGAPSFKSVLIRTSEQDGSPLVLDVIGLPAREWELQPSARVLIAVRGADQGSERRTALLQALYGMTTAEVDIALQLCAGTTPETIAANRAVSIGTVRAQIKALLAKAGVSRQIELVAKINQY
jgi:DNA-binding CsgD family transcriptional regulator